MNLKTKREKFQLETSSQNILRYNYKTRQTCYYAGHILCTLRAFEQTMDACYSTSLREQQLKRKKLKKISESKKSRENLL